MLVSVSNKWGINVKTWEDEKGKENMFHSCLDMYEVLQAICILKKSKELKCLWLKEQGTEQEIPRRAGEE